MVKSTPKLYQNGFKAGAGFPMFVECLDSGFRNVEDQSSNRRYMCSFCVGGTTGDAKFVF